MATTIDDLKALGYTAGIAHGSVQVEQDALAAAQQAAGIDAVTASADTITTATVQDLANAGKLPAANADRQALVAKITSAALDLVQQGADEKVAFHERALAIAQEMPDVWRVEQAANGQTVLSTLIACKEDGTGWDEGAQTHLDALADPDQFAERVWLLERPDVADAVAALQTAGHVVARPQPGADVFTVDGKTLDSAAVVELAASVSAAG